MQKPLATKVQETVQYLRKLWPRLEGKHRLIAFSTGKDSLAMTAMLYEAVESEKPICMYSHHGLEFSSNLEYLEELKERGFVVSTVSPFLGYFDLMERGISFLTRKDPWCVPMLVGTGILEWLQGQGARSPRDGVMFRGMSGSEYSHKFHTRLELYKRLDLPTFNPILSFTKDEIIEVIRTRYNLPLNPIYEHMGRTYCICCYTSDARRQQYSNQHFPEVCTATMARSSTCCSTAACLTRRLFRQSIGRKKRSWTGTGLSIGIVSRHKTWLVPSNAVAGPVLWYIGFVKQVGLTPSTCSQSGGSGALGERKSGFGIWTRRRLTL